MLVDASRFEFEDLSKKALPTNNKKGIKNKLKNFLDTIPQ